MFETCRKCPVTNLMVTGVDGPLRIDEVVVLNVLARVNRADHGGKLAAQRNLGSAHHPCFSHPIFSPKKRSALGLAQISNNSRLSCSLACSADENEKLFPQPASRINQVLGGYQVWMGVGLEDMHHRVIARVIARVVRDDPAPQSHPHCGLLVSSMGSRH